MVSNQQLQRYAYLQSLLPSLLRERARLEEKIAENFPEGDTMHSTGDETIRVSVETKYSHKFVRVEYES